MSTRGTTIRSTIAALAIVGAVAGVTATAQADTDPCADVPAAQDKLRVATSEWQVASASANIATDLHMDRAPRLQREADTERVEYLAAIAAYDTARDACAASR